jgi:hypothetical protein
MKIIIIIFFLLHGLVYLLYAGQGMRLFEMKSGMKWPDGSWACSKLLDKKTIRHLAVVFCTITTLGFVSGSLAILLNLVWWKSLVVKTAIFSSLLFILLCDGKKRKLDEQGGIGILINLVIIALYNMDWPDFGF